MFRAVKAALVFGSRSVSTTHGTLKLPKLHEDAPGLPLLSIRHRAAGLDDCSALIDVMIKRFYPVVCPSSKKINRDTKLNLLEAEIKKAEKVFIVAYRENEVSVEEKLVGSVGIGVKHYANTLFSTRDLPGMWNIEPALHQKRVNKNKKDKKYKKEGPYEKDAYIELLVVDEEASRRGLGTSLVRLACQEAKKRSMVRVFATCWSKNSNVRKAIAKAGMMKISSDSKLTPLDELWGKQL